MLCLSGFELYSRWVPLYICVAFFVSFASVSRDNKDPLFHALCRPLDWNQQNLPLCTRGGSCFKNAHSYLMNKRKLI